MDNRKIKQFEFAKKLWENSTGKKYSGSKEDTLEIQKYLGTHENFN